MKNCLNILAQTPGVLSEMLREATKEELNWQPAADRWSISMVLAHLANVEVKGFRNRFRAMVEEKDPFLPSYDQLAPFRSGARFDGLAELASFDKERRQTLAWLKTLPDTAGDHAGRHEEFGVITFAQLLNEFAFHDLGHIRQVAEVYRAHVFYPRMGAFQSFYKINP